MPSPRPNESRADFMSRCMADDKMNDEFGNPRQRAAVCATYFDDKDKKTASEEYEDWGEVVSAAEYQGRKVTLNKPFRTPGQKKKFAVYVQNPAGKTIIVRFGDPNMEIKRDDPKRRKAFRDRHNCDTAKDKTTPRYWSCRQWRGGSKVEANERDTMNKKESVEAAEPKPKSTETHEQYMDRCMAMGNSKEACMKAHEGHTFKDQNEPHYKRDHAQAAPRDPRSTPAPPKDRRKGSKRNKPGSARPGGKVTFSESVTNSLKKKVSDHNKKSEKKVTLGMLKAVYRRGAGAYSTSHRPGVSRAAWSMARVNAFLTLVRRGRPANPKYTQDNDLLPSNHARKSKKASEDDCACGGHTVEAAKVGKDMYDNPGEAMERAKEMGLDAIHTMDRGGEKIFMPGKNHDEYMSKTNSKEVEGYDEDDEDAKAAYMKKKLYSEDEDEEKKKKKKGYSASDDSCPVGEELVAGVCQPINVTMEVTIDEVVAKVEAKTGKSFIEISGIAFHEGMNKNNWSLTRKGADVAMAQMVGADLTLNHPKPTKIGFSRNMDGGVDEAVVGIVTEASLEELEAGQWNVRYTAQVQRTELFEALESGLWLRAGYGVSIGGYGVPLKANEDGTMIFESDFTFDHLAIVHKPAYNRANIESVKKIKPMVASNERTFKYQPDSPTEHQTEGIPMDEDMINEEMGAVASEALAEAEALKADLILAQATIAEYKALEAKKVEDERLELVAKATEMGLKGHEDLSSDTISSLIASWEESRPQSEPAEMKPVEPAVASESPAPAKSEAVVANYLNGVKLQTPEDTYERAFNAWASAWNKTLSGVEARNDRFKAPKYEEIKEMI